MCKYESDTVILQETKMVRMDRDVLHSLCPFSSLDWIAIPSIGEAGGILMVWNKEKVEQEEYWIDSFSVSLVATVSGENQKWIITGAYGPSSGTDWSILLLNYSPLEA